MAVVGWGNRGMRKVISVPVGDEASYFTRGETREGVALN
jgi:hypothetical protein